MTYIDFTPEELRNEEWRESAHHPKLLVSNLGRVMSFRTVPAQILTGSINKGYVRLHLREKSVSTYMFIHVLVANTFIPNPDNKPQVNHKNGHKGDNRVDNLEWNTALENKQHAKQNGLVAVGKRTRPDKIPYGDDHWTHQKPHLVKNGTNHHRSKLSLEQIQYIHQTYQPKVYTALRIATELNVSKKTILNVLHGATYTKAAPQSG